MNKDFLRKRRIEVGLSQEFIANKLGYSIQTISLWESGKATPSLMVWSKYASLLKVDLEGLILDKDKKDNNYSDDLVFDTNKFANELRRLRKNKELTQIDLSKKLNINVGLIIKFEKGKSFPNVKQFISLCVFYKLSFDELYFSLSLKKVVEEKPHKRHFVPLPVLIPIIIVLGAGTATGSALMISSSVKKRNSSNVIEEENINNANNVADFNDNNNSNNPQDNDTGGNSGENQSHIDIVLNDDELTFGYYPQKHISDVDLITTLNGLSPNEQGYYEYSDKLYEKCRSHYLVSHSKDNWFDDETKVMEDEDYYFSVEPLVWTLIEENEDGYLVISKDIIDVCYYDDVYEDCSNNYEESALRNYLNNDFLNKAFYTCKDRMIEVEVDNSLLSTGDTTNHYVCDNTFDYVFAPSIIELEEYVGCSLPFTYPLPDNVTRDLKAKTSDYYRCKDGTTDNDNYGNYWLRSPESDRNNYAKTINSNGKYFVSNHVYREIGIRPIIKIHK